MFDDTLIFTFIYTNKGFVFHYPITDGFPYDFFFDKLFILDGMHPPLLKAHLGGRISIETLAIFQKIFNYVENFDKIIKEEIVWKPIRNRILI